MNDGKDGFAQMQESEFHRWIADGKKKCDVVHEKGCTRDELLIERTLLENDDSL